MAREVFSRGSELYFYFSFLYTQGILANYVFKIQSEQYIPTTKEEICELKEVGGNAALLTRENRNSFIIPCITVMQQQEETQIACKTSASLPLQ